MTPGAIDAIPALGGGGGAVSSVAGRTGAVVLTAADVGAGQFPDGVLLPSGIIIPSGADISGILGTSGSKAAAGNDSRLSDTRVPTDGSVTNTKVAVGAGIAASKISGTAQVVSDTPAGAFRATDHGVSFWTYDPLLISGNSILSSGLCGFTKVPTRGPATAITTVYYYLHSTGTVVTGAGAWLYVFKSDGTILGTSGDLSTKWTTGGNAAAFQSESISFTTVADSFVWVAMHVPSASTYPAFGKFGSLSTTAPNLNLSAAASRMAALTSQAAKITSAITPSSLVQNWSAGQMFVGLV